MLFNINIHNLFIYYCLDYYDYCCSFKHVYAYFSGFFLCVYYSDTAFWQLIACSITGLIFWLCICFAMRYTLKLLLMYKGWMYESREKGQSISTTTKLWVAVTRVLSSWNTPGLYSFQGSLPRLPLPAVHDTMSRVSYACDYSVCDVGSRQR